jgi:hypothetical protein
VDATRWHRFDVHSGEVAMAHIGKVRTLVIRLPLVVCCCLLVAAAVPGWADEKKQSGSASAAKKTSAKTKSKSLADFAAKVKLKGTQGEDNKITIDNHNLSETSGRGTLSTGGGVSTGEAAAKDEKTKATGSSGTASAQTELKNDYAQQKAKVEAMEKSLADFEAEAAKKDPHFANSAHDRSPGTRAPDELTREKAGKELAAEKQKLEALRKQAEKDGVELESPK